MRARRFDQMFGEEVATIPHPSKAHQSAERFRAELMRQFHPGDRVPSGRVLAERLAISRNTVSKVLAQLADEGWLAHEPEGSYRVSGYQRRSVNTTGLLFPFDPDILLTSPFYRDVGIGISQMAGETHRHVLHLHSSGHELNEVQPALFWSPEMRALDSLICLDIFDADLLVRAGETYPVVCVDADYRLPGVSTVEFDNRSAVRMAFKYLLDLGHRRIGFIGRTTSMDPSITQRWDAYRQAFDWMGLKMDPDWVFEVRSVEHVRRSAAHWLAMAPERRPTAMIVIDRFWQLMPVWLAAGVKIPEQISFVTLGVIELWSDYLQFAWRSFSEDYRTVTAAGLHPPFANHPPELALMQPTTVNMPGRAMGRWGMAEIVRRMADPSSSPVHHVLPSELVIGNTTAPPPASP